MTVPVWPAGVLAILLLAGCRASAPTKDRDPSVSELQPEQHQAVEPAGNLIAESTVPLVRVFKRPDAPEPFVTFKHPGPLDTPRVFLVESEAGRWLRVFLPMEPNGSMGWVRARDVELSTTSYRILVDISANRLIVFDDERVVMRESVAVGTGGTPTPTGDFYITMLVRPPDPGGPYGPYAYGLSAYSEVLNTFAGGDGQVAIHGTNDPSSVGLAVSHGCVRMRNPAITRLTRLLPLGTPVRIRA